MRGRRTLVALLSARWMAAATGASANDPASSPSPVPTATPGSSDTPVGGWPYARRVHGRPDYGLSPYAPNSGYVDVRGCKRGEAIRCPYTNKIFRVP